MDPNDHEHDSLKNETSCVFWLKVVMFSFKTVIPKNRRENPKSRCPIELRVELLLWKNGKDRPMIGNTNKDNEYLNPNKEIIQENNVEPTFAPNMTANDCANEINPPFTKLTIITIVVEEDNTRTVIIIPVNMA